MCFPRNKCSKISTYETPHYLSFLRSNFDQGILIIVSPRGKMENFSLSKTKTSSLHVAYKWIIFINAGAHCNYFLKSHIDGNAFSQKNALLFVYFIENTTQNNNIKKKRFFFLKSLTIRKINLFLPMHLNISIKLPVSKTVLDLIHPEKCFFQKDKYLNNSKYSFQNA